MATGEHLSASLEDYLEAIFHIAAEKQAARAKDISGRMHVSRSSVTGALHALADRGLVNYAPYDLITLTPEGRAVAADMVRRHQALRDFFVTVLAVEESAADEAACKMEHAVPRGLLERFVQFAEFVRICPRGGEKLLKGFDHYCEHGREPARCERCVSLCLEEFRKGRTTRDRAEGNGC